MVACIAWRFWLGALSNKAYESRRGQRNHEEIGALLCAQLDKNTQNSHATQAISMVALQLYGYEQVVVSPCDML